MDIVNHVDAIALSLGYTVMAAIAVCIMAGVVIGAATLSNRAQHKMLESVGGWKMFVKYMRWYQSQQKTESSDESD